MLKISVLTMTLKTTTVGFFTKLKPEISEEPFIKTN